MSTELGLKKLSEISGDFLVPAYQRGFRWGKEEIEALLDDISGNLDNNYCLQPIVLKRIGQNKYELIDGQQRLTTIFLTLSYMINERLKNIDLPFSIEYATRPGSEEYLKNIDKTKKEANIDFLHIYNAYQTIKGWFERNADKNKNKIQFLADKIYGAFHETVTVIWYETADDVDGETLFIRLNIGRIPLTNAELVKALLVTNVDGAKIETKIKIATQWDIIEKDLRDDRFWSFLTNEDAAKYPTRIDFILDMIAEKGKFPNHYHTFEYFRKVLEGEGNSGKRISSEFIWEKIKDRFELLKEWCENRELYHKVGYLVTVGIDMAGLVKEASTRTKSSFLSFLDDKIIEELDMTADNLKTLSYEQKKEYEQIKRLLTLFNVESVRTVKNSEDKYPFNAHKKQGWTLEHIHAQCSEALNKEEQWREYLNRHKNALEAIIQGIYPDTSKYKRVHAEITAILAKELTGEIFRHASQMIENCLREDGLDDDIHSISNLALLSSPNNSALKCSVFEVKRQKILEIDKAGEYIPPCTRRVFLKYYSGADVLQPHFWGKEDRKAYIDAIIEKLEPYLKKEKIS